MSAAIQQNRIWLNKQKRKAFYTPVASENLRDGAEALLQVSLTTNTEMPEDGWMDGWNKCVCVCVYRHQDLAEWSRTQWCWDSSVTGEPPNYRKFKTMLEFYSESFKLSLWITFLSVCLALTRGFCSPRSDALDFEHGTVIMRINQGMDISHILKAEGTTNSQNNKTFIQLNYTTLLCVLMR